MKPSRQRGWITMEMLAVVGLLLLIGGGLAMMLRATAVFHADQMARQQCIAAAQATLESLAATGQRLDEADVQRLWPKMAIEVDQAPGQGDWEGLTRVRVTATRTTRLRSKPVQVHLVRYLDPEDRP